MPAHQRPHRSANEPPPTTGLARALSKLGFCSRSQARDHIVTGRVRVDGTVRRDPEWRVRLGGVRITVDDHLLGPTKKVYLLLNKPRGLVTTAADEHDRATVFQCLQGADLPFVSPVGRLDKASEGLLLLTNDTEWAAHITDPRTRLEKIYHVQIGRVADQPLLAQIAQGVLHQGERLETTRASILRTGTRNSWLEIVLAEGKNRHLRRLLEALGVQVLRLVRVAIGELQLGNVPKGAFRRLTEAEVRLLGPKS
jgi:23S rRNA pseudouridine2605 synthase